MNKWIWALLLLAVTLAGCDLFSRDFYLQESDFPDKNLGALVLLLDGNSIATKTIAPGDMDVVYYDLTFTHTTAANNFTAADWRLASAYSKNGLAPGSWNVTVVAKDSAKVPIGAYNGATTNTFPFSITAGVITTTLPVSVIPLTGNGTLTLNLSWPVGSVTSPPTIASFLAPAGAAIPDDALYAIPQVNWTINESTRSASCSVTKATGYWTLLLRLSGAGTPVWGWADSARIVSGKTSNGTLALTSGTGGLTLVITQDMQNPIQINWNSPPPASIAVNQNIAVTAQPVPLTPTAGYAYNYQWYLNGSSLGTSYQSASISYGSTLAPGDYGLCVVVTEKQSPTGSGIRTISSNGFNFNVH